MDAFSDLSASEDGFWFVVVEKAKVLGAREIGGFSGFSMLRRLMARLQTSGGRGV